MPDLSPSLRVLGVPALHGPDGEPITFRTRKHFALLIYLALEPQVHRREKVAALLWPSGTTAEARHSLATGLSVLRARLGRERIETDRDTVRLVPGSVELDLDRLARGEIHATETAPALAVAPLLQEFEVADAGPWDHWRDGAAARWQPAIRDALLTLIDRSRRQGNTRTMEVLADAMLRLDDLSEEGVRAKMESRAFAGDRLTALHIYEEWRVRLADELGAQPSELVAGMALRLRRRGWERESGEHIAAVRTDQWKDRPFVGRGTEYQTLYEGWEGAQRGAARHALLTGESGIGKSTLIERLTTAAGLQGAVSCRMQCYEVEREIPYGAIGGLVGLLLDQPGAGSIAPEWLSELSRTVNAVRRRFPNVTPPPESTGEMVRIRLADAVHELVRAIAEEHPVILVMDDIHLGDDASVAVLHLLLRRLTDERTLVLCTLRQGDGLLGPSARGMLDRAELAQMSVVPLPPLTEGESTELLGHLVPSEVPQPPSTVRRALLRAAAGLPMLLELLVRDWLGHGDRCVALAVEAMTEEPGTAGGAGETYRRLLERLTLGLDPITRSVLNLAAVLGSQLNEFELYGLVDLTLAQAMAGLSQLASLRIFRDGGQGLEFVNEVMRGEVYLAVPSSVRRLLHSKVADRLIERHHAGEQMLGLAIAWHCMRSRRVDEAGQWLIAGGKEAIARSALAEAEAALESGLRNLPPTAREGCVVLLIGVLIDQMRFEDAERIADILDSEGTVALSPTAKATIELARLSILIRLPQSAESVLNRLIAMMGDAPSESMRLRTTTVAVTLASESLRDDFSSRLLGAIDAMRGSIPQEHIPRFDLHCAQLLYWRRQMDQVEAILIRLTGSETRDGPSLLQQNLYVGLATACVARGDYKASIGLMSHAADLAARAGSPNREASACGNLAVSHFRLGDLDLALMAARKARRVSGGTAHGASYAGACGVELCYHALSHDEKSFRHSLAETESHAERSSSPGILLLGRLWIADAFLLAGEVDEASRRAAVALASLEEVPVAWSGVLARWAGNLHAREPLLRYRAIIESSLRKLNDVDMLDRLEISLAGNSLTDIGPNQRASLQEAANGAMVVLPAFATRLLRRLGPPTGLESAQRRTRIHPLERR